MSEMLNDPVCVMDRTRYTYESPPAAGPLLLVLAFLVGGCALVRPDTSLTTLVTNARLPTNHAALAQSYRDRAHRLRVEASEHAALADWWSSLAGGTLASTGSGRYEQAQHCRRLAANLAAAAEDAEGLAEFHARLAQPPAEPGGHSGWRHRE